MMICASLFLFIHIFNLLIFIVSGKVRKILRKWSLWPNGTSLNWFLWCRRSDTWRQVQKKLTLTNTVDISNMCSLHTSVKRRRSNQSRWLCKINHKHTVHYVPVFLFTFQFVLKHEKYFKLREVETIPNSLNPQAQGSMDLVQDMLTQVMKKHPEAKWFHIGADEVSGSLFSTDD